MLVEMELRGRVAQPQMRTRRTSPVLTGGSIICAFDGCRTSGQERVESLFVLGYVPARSLMAEEFQALGTTARRKLGDAACDDTLFRTVDCIARAAAPGELQPGGTTARDA